MDALTEIETEIERIGFEEVIDLGDACVKTRQNSSFPIVVDCIFGVGSKSC